ncbi:NAD-dependent epimerase/dehydratase family protein [Flavobacterium selenitireducens]|uniref:NAD-dependent epimerase/dehydratase family protein n=1 Tax=Flavobacterium selenitireducens TaxID=2722704 RepID=UPI00168B7A18|nr:NAD-dependent epimerase/dehydratase family protein [Flavobacterium selenitireducens]MBD3581580.1 NAD-dependent epimerase/dehydratase family protein [Flavobacterium selenitireducens]
MSKILVTGGAGFVGSSLCLQLKKRYPESEIVAFDNLKRRGSELNLADLIRENIGFVHGDIRNAEDLAAVREFDVLIEASAEPSVMAGLDSDPTYVINNNLYGSINCFNACLKNKAKLIFLSTSRVYPIKKIESANYDELETRFAFSESQPEPGLSENGISEKLSLDGARSFYGTTKLASELFIAEYSAFYGLQAAVTRFGVIAGPRQMGKTDQGVVTLWMAKHFWKQSLKYIGYGGTGKQVRDILHIDDLVDLVDLQIRETEKFTGRIFNAGGGLENSASLQEMTRLCESITGNSITIGSETENRPADLRIFVTDNSAITEATGWKPKRSVEDVFKDIYDWINSNEVKLKPILS